MAFENIGKSLSSNRMLKEETCAALGDADFAVCELCFWAATAFRTAGGHRILDKCPLCLAGDDSLSFIPLGKDESYRFWITEKRGLEIEFSLR